MRKQKTARRKGEGVRVARLAPLAPSPRLEVTPRAREISDEEIAAATGYEERGLVCLGILAAGRWDAEVPRLKRLWLVTDVALNNYRRAGKVALAAVTEEGREERLLWTLSSLQVQADDCEADAKFYKSRNRPTTAAKYIELQRKAIDLLAEIGGLKQHRVTVSIEADPRIAGMYQAILSALEDFDRMRDTFLAEVAELTGGTLPAAPLPSAREHVRDAVKRYEGEIGARSEARRLAA